MTSAAVANDMVVGIHFTLRGEDAQVIDSSDGQAPFLYLHGRRQIVPGLERALTGRSVGEKFSIELPPEDAFGQVSADMIMDFPKTQFPAGAVFEVGNEFELVGEDGQVIPAHIRAVSTDSVTLDTNHPLAGQRLFFEVEIVSLRAATQEELDHGHAHGEGGSHD